MDELITNFNKKLNISTDNNVTVKFDINQEYIYLILNINEDYSEALNLLKDIFENSIAQKYLIALYSLSQSECTRNGKCGMEIGMAREKDQCAVLKYFLGETINYNIDNSLPEDFKIRNEKVSIKHSSGKIGTPVKAKWTSSDNSVQNAIKIIINERDEYYPHLLITYIDLINKKITIICITAEYNKYVIKTLKEEAFIIQKGNSRGIEYSKKAMVMFLSKPYFRITIEDADLTNGINPIDRRLNYIKKLK